VRRAFKYRLRPGSNAERELFEMKETHRRLYNACLDQRKVAYEAGGTSLRSGDQSAWYKGQRRVNPFFARINFSSAQATMRRLDRAFKAFFRRVKEYRAAKGEVAPKPGYPRFKAYDRFDSFEFPKLGDGIRLNGTTLRVQNVGDIPVILHRPLGGRIKTVSLKYEGDKWYVVFSCEIPDVPVLPSDKPPVGIDVGLESFLTTSAGEKEPNPRCFKTALPELRRRSRAVSRKRLRGKNRRKAVRALRKMHARVRDLRDYLTAYLSVRTVVPAVPPGST